MTKTYSLRRLLPCFTAAPTAPCSSSTTKKRLSTSLRNPSDDDGGDGASSTASDDSAASHIPPRPSKSMVICTFFGHRHSHVWFCVQLHRLSPKPSLLLQLSISTQTLIHQMRSGLLRLALQSAAAAADLPLHSAPLWTIFSNGRKLGFASRRKPSDDTRLILQKMQSITVGAGVLPSDDGDVMYMRANYEWVVGGADSESYHLISPDADCPGQDLSIFLLRSRS